MSSVLLVWTDLFLFLGVKAYLSVRACVNKGATDEPVLFSPSFRLRLIKLEISTTAGSFVLFLRLIRSENLLTRAVPHVKPISEIQNNLERFKGSVLTQIFRQGLGAVARTVTGSKLGSRSEQTGQDTRQRSTTIITAHSEWNKQVRCV